jgi:hypothetical protein
MTSSTRFTQWRRRQGTFEQRCSRSISFWSGFDAFGKSFEKNGGDDETRTRDLCRDSIAGNGFTTTYKNAGTAKIPASRTRIQEL